MRRNFSSQGSLSVAQRMRLSVQLGGFALALPVFSVGPVEASVGEPVEPAKSLAQQLQGLVKTIRIHPRDAEDRYFASQEVMDSMETVVRLVLKNLFEFVYGSDDCRPTLRDLTRDFKIGHPRSPALADYACRFQHPSFLYGLSNSYLCILRDMCENVRLWRGASSGSFDALARFLKSDVEALRTTREMKVYHELILPSGPEVFLDSHEDSTESTEAAILRRTEEVEKFKQKVCEDYKVLANGVGKLFEQMIDELGSILGDLEDENCAKAYEFLKKRLNASYWFISICPFELERQAVGFKTSFREEPSEALALAQVRIFEMVLDFKLKFPEMNHDDSGSLGLFSKDYGFRGAFDGGPPLIGSVMARAPEDPGKWSAFLSIFGVVLEKLRTWVCSLLKKSQANGGSVADEQAKRWLNEVESNLCLVLESIGNSGGKQELYTLTGTFEKWDSIAVNIERMLVMLYGMGNLRRGEGEPGCYLIKLRQVIGKVLGEGAGVKSARTTKGPEAACGDENLQEEEGSQAGPEPDQSEGNSVNSAEGLMLPDDCVAGGGTNGPMAERALILQSELAEEFAEGMDLGSELELC